MKEKIWMNGVLKDFGESHTHILTHALHYATAVFEGIRCYETPIGPAILRLDDHITRLYNSAKIYFMNIPYSRNQLIDAIKELVRENNLNECYIRPLIYYDFGKMGVNPLPNNVSVAIALWKWDEYLKKDKKEGIKLMISSWSRIDNRTMPVHAKATANYANSALARIEAIKSGFDEALLLNTDGRVVEASAENIFIIQDGILITPPISSGALNGITRKSIIDIAKELDIGIEIRDISRDEVYISDEIFLTGTASEIKAVYSVDNRTIGDGSTGNITQKLIAAFDEIKLGKNKKFISWLTFV